MHLGAKPIFVDVLDDQTINYEQIEKKITKNTKAILPVHLTGKMSNMIEVMKIAKRNNLKVVEDAAQAIGSKLNNKRLMINLILTMSIAGLWHGASLNFVVW